MRMNALWLVAMLAAAAVVVVSAFHLRPAVSDAEFGLAPFCVDPTGTPCPTPWPAATGTPTPTLGSTPTPETVFSLDGDPATASVESSITVAVGTRFTVDLVLEQYADPLPYGSYQAKIRYSDEHLNAVLGGPWSTTPSIEQHGNLAQFMSGAVCVPHDSTESLMNNNIFGDTTEDNTGINAILLGCLEAVHGNSQFTAQRLVRFAFDCDLAGTSEITVVDGSADPFGTYMVNTGFAPVVGATNDVTITCVPPPPPVTSPRDVALSSVRDRICARLGEDHPACATLRRLAP
jgi:hypothetical protein